MLRKNQKEMFKEKKLMHFKKYFKFEKEKAMKIITNIKEFETDITDISLLFFPCNLLVKNDNIILKHYLDFKENLIINKISLVSIKDKTEIDGKECDENEEICLSEASYSNKIATFKNDDQKNETVKNLIRLAVYKSISAYSYKKFPWGCLTNENPIKIAKQLIKQGEDIAYIEEKLIEYFAVEPKNAKLVSQILSNQKDIINNENLVNLYINISSYNNSSNFINFSVNKCIDARNKNQIILGQKAENYGLEKETEICRNNGTKNNDVTSFFKNQVKNFENNEHDFSTIFPSYFNALIKEIKALKKIIVRKAYVVKTIYIGGDIALLNANELGILLEELAFLFSEFTVECGSPRSLTKNKLQILKNYGVTRISINPETFTSKTLKQMQKNFNFQDLINFYKDCMEFDFIINIDLTAGIPNENLKNFKKNIGLLLELSPDNITINANLNNKQISTNEIVETSFDKINQIVDMVNYANEKLVGDGYKPYFLQKEMIFDNNSSFENNCLVNTNIKHSDNEDKIGNSFKDNFGDLINKNIDIIGYCKTGTKSIFELNISEQNSILMACGVNSTSSIVVDDFKQQQVNPKSITQYIGQLESIIIEKLKLFK